MKAYFIKSQAELRKWCCAASVYNKYEKAISKVLLVSHNTEQRSRSWQCVQTASQKDRKYKRKNQGCGLYKIYKSWARGEKNQPKEATSYIISCAFSQST